MGMMNQRAHTFYGNGLYIQCANGGLLTTSSDLITWTARVSAVPLVSFNAGAYGASVYVIVGNTSTTGRIQSSSDGITWTERTSNAGNNTLLYVIFAAGTINLFIAPGAAGTVVTSPDGITWTSQVSNLGGSNAGIAIAFDGTTVVIVAAFGKISTSTDGITWTARTTNTTVNSLAGVAWNGSIFCAIGASLSVSVITSPDGITWTKQDPKFPITITSGILCWVTSDSAGVFLMCYQNSTALYRSTDGINWTSQASWFDCQTVDYMNSRYILQCSDNSIITSTDCITWQKPSLRCGSFNFGKIYWFSALSKYYMSQSNLGGIVTSTDGSTFDGSKSTSINDIVYSVSQTKIVGVGTNGLIVTSTDSGASFQINNSLFTGGNTSLIHNLTSIAYSSSLDRFVTVSTYSGIFTSPNGTTWTQRAYASPVGVVSFKTVIYVAAKSLFVAVGSGVIITSPDGITWTERISLANSNAGFIDVKYNTSLDRFIACGTGCPIMISTNGTIWTRISNPSGGIKVGFSCICNLEADGFVLIGDSKELSLYSTDTITWYQRFIPREAFGSISLPKSIYSTIDSCSLWIGGSSSVPVVPGSIIIMKSTGVSDIIPISPVPGTNSQFIAIVYISADDSYVCAGTNGLFCKLKRSYNRSTQFALPVLQNTLRIT
ncbi:MAG: hypothetical protein IPP74_15265 [Alphaproteobacteria bacterium]|nr:hypothetical protein [Alphaproteobacteria bacterium]